MLKLCEIGRSNDGALCPVRRDKERRWQFALPFGINFETEPLMQILSERPIPDAAKPDDL